MVAVSCGFALGFRAANLKVLDIGGDSGEGIAEVNGPLNHFDTPSLERTSTQSHEDSNKGPHLTSSDESHREDSVVGD